MEPLFQITTTKTYQDYKKMCRISMTNPRKLLSFLLLYLAAGFLFYRLTFKISVVVIMVPVCMLISWIGIQVKIKRAWKSYENTPKETTLSFYEDYLEVSNIQGSVQKPYREFYKIVDYKLCYLFFVGINQAIYIPKRDCSPELIDFLSKKVEK